MFLHFFQFLLLIQFSICCSDYYCAQCIDNVCKKCTLYYFLRNGTCINQDTCYQKTCVACNNSSIGSCTQCEQSHTLLPNGTCLVNCASSNCISCEDQEPQICDQCQNGYLLYQGLCYANSCQMDHCDSCSGGTCSECSSGYYQNSNTNSCEKLSTLFLILGLVFGSIAFIFIILIVIACYCEKKQEKLQQTQVQNMQTEQAIKANAPVQIPNQSSVQHTFIQMAPQENNFVVPEPIYSYSNQIPDEYMQQILHQEQANRNQNVQFEDRIGREFDNNGNYAGRVDQDGRKFDQNGNYHGRIDTDGRKFDQNGNYQGRVDNDGRMFDNNGNYQGRRDNDGREFDKDGNYHGRVDPDGRRFDQNGNYLGRVDQ